MAGIAALAAPFMLVQTSPLAAVGVGVAYSHLWLLNLRQTRQSMPSGAYPIAFVIAVSGMGWLMAGTIILARFGK